MRTGKLADLLCTTGWQRLYTVPKGEHGVVSIHLVSTDATAITIQVRHVAQGNSGAVTHTAKHCITTPYVITTDVYTIKELGVGSLDDIWVSSDVAGILAASINTQGIEHSHGVTQRDNRI